MALLHFIARINDQYNEVHARSPPPLTCLLIRTLSKLQIPTSVHKCGETRELMKWLL